MYRNIARALFLCALAASAQSSSWHVKQEWVRAHEDFLASDVMQGRGSATHDEEIAATYVASNFESYGLQHAPGMNSYIQSAFLVAPKLDGHATLTVGKKVLAEGTDFDLLMSSAEKVTGLLVVLDFKKVAEAKFEQGSVVLVTGVEGDPGAIFNIIRPLRSAGAGAVLLSGPAVPGLKALTGGVTRVPMRLAEAQKRPSATIALIHDPAKLIPQAGKSVVIGVQPLPEAKPRATYNAIGYLPGTDPHAGTLLLSAHLDHLGIAKPVNGDEIYNGADDDAAGTTAVLELAHALAAGPRPIRSILFICYGGEELGGLGSTYFVAHSPVPLKDLITNLEFEMIGNQDPKMPKGVLLLTGWDRSNLGPTLAAHGALLGPDPYPEQHFFERSDNYSLAVKGVVAHTAAGWGTPPTYHQPDDDISHLDLPFMTAAIQSLIGPIQWLASSDFVPQWNPGSQPKE